MQKYWKTFTGKCIHQEQSGIKVYENCRYRWLLTGSQHIQTLICKPKPQKPELQYILPLTFGLRNSPGKTCLLGLGGGGIVHFLNKTSVNLTTVEIDNTVINVAKNFFYLNKSSDITIINQDAQGFVENYPEKFQHLLVDISSAYSFPQNCKNLEFFYNCQQILEPEGVLAINISDKEDFTEILGFVRQLFQNKTVCIPIKNYTNNIILASNNYTSKNLIEIYAKNSEIKNIQWDCTWGYIAEFDRKLF